jgi:Icc-related predicted phosphoesterase
MKIALLSDLHLSMQSMAHPRTDADVVVLAGDVWRPAGAIEWARQFDRPTLFVAGNHEFYGSDLVTTMKQLRELAAGSSVRVLEKEQWHHDGVRFLGCTLWSDYRLYDSAAYRDAVLPRVAAELYDFTRVRVAPDFDDRFTPALSQLLFDSSVAWLEERFAEPHAGPTVVVTHFAPSRQSIAARFANSPLNACFVSDLEACILRWQPQLWLHGHTHDSFDYRIGATRVIANPRGYARGGEVENKVFDPKLVIELA